jgi:hypothetical protein
MSASVTRSCSNSREYAQREICFGSTHATNHTDILYSCCHRFLHANLKQQQQQQPQCLDESTYSGVRVGTKPIDQLLFIPECSLLLVLCDGRLTSIDPDTLALTQTLIKAKCRDFCCNELDHFYHQICASVGVDKLVLFEHKSQSPSHVGTLMQISQVTTRSQTLVCRWNGPSVCLANASTYWVVDQDLNLIDTHVMWNQPASSSGVSGSSGVNEAGAAAGDNATLLGSISPGE